MRTMKRTKRSKEELLVSTPRCVQTLFCAISCLRAVRLQSNFPFPIIDTHVYQGFLQKQIIPLVNVPSCRQLALQALSSITHHGGQTCRFELSKYTNILVQSLEDYPTDLVGAEHIIGTVSHCMIASCTIDESPFKQSILRVIDFPKLVRATMALLKRPGISDILMQHAADMINSIAFTHKASCRDKTVVNFMVAGLRSKDWSFRSVCFGSIQNLYHSCSMAEYADIDPFSLLGGIPPRQVELLKDYGVEKSDSAIAREALADCQSAMKQCAQDKDYCALGMKLYELILRSEYSVSQVMGDPRLMNDLPFFIALDALPYCAKELRKQGKLDEADALDAKYGFRGPAQKSIAIAQRAIARNPERAYFYYITSYTADHVTGLRLAKKGLKCKDITPFIRHQLLWLAVQHASQYGMRLLRDLGPFSEEHQWSEGMSFLLCAIEDAKIYIAEASPDNRNMKNVIYWYIILSVIIAGPDTTPELKELQAITLSICTLSLC
jgi:hypothetical protein